MCHPSKWLWGLLPLLLLVLVTLWIKTDQIEDNLAKRTNTERRDEGHRWARVEMDGRDLNLTGTAPTEADRAAMLDIATAIRGVRIVNNDMALLEAIAPYTWSAERDDKNIVLSGYAPNRNARKAIVDAAKDAFPDLRVKNELEYGRGAPDGFEAVIASAFSQLGRLQNGVARLSDKTLTVTGQAASMEAYDAARAVLDNPQLPARFTLGNSDISRPVASPFVWSVVRDGSALALTGHAPGAAQKSAIISQAIQNFPNFSIDDQTGLADGAPRNWAAAVNMIMQQISRLSNGLATITDTEISISGEAVHAAAAAAIDRNMANALPPGFTGSADITIAAAGEQVDLFACQDLFNEVMSNEKILFDSGKATISAASLRVIDALVSVALRCPGGKLAIIGHTDSDGDDDLNRTLSEQRAASVRDAMTAAGIVQSRLTAIGYGETRPVASNETDEGKAANRRIEFRIVRIQQ